MRIGIDARFFGSVGKGLGRYTQKLIENLEKIDRQNEYFVFLRRENFEEYRPRHKNFQKVLADYPWYTFSEQLNMPRVLKRYKLDLAHFPHFNVPIFYGGKFVITIHDLILLHYPTTHGTTLSPFFYGLKFLAYRLTIGLAVWRAQKVITVSEFTKKDILEKYKNISASKVVVTYEACDKPENIVLVDAEEILRKYGIIKPYILYVGNAYPHKNLEKLARAFSQLKKKRNDLNLVLVGKEDYFYSRLKHLVKTSGASGVIFADFVPDEDLTSVYQNAVLYVFPSLYEGFGLPPLEAMANGVPVASSSRASLPEILGPAARYFNPENPDEMARTIEEVLDSGELRRVLIKNGYAQIKKYDWERMAEETLEIYQKNN